MWKSAYGLSFAQIGLISLVTQVTSSLLQPAVGLVSDHRPQPYSLSVGMGATLIGLLLLFLVPSGLGLLAAMVILIVVFGSLSGETSDYPDSAWKVGSAVIVCTSVEMRIWMSAGMSRHP